MSENLSFKVTRLHRLDGDGAMKAFVDVAVNESLVLKGLRVVEGKKGIFVSMPKQQGKDSKWYDTVQPLNKAVQDEIAAVILEAYKAE